MNRDEFLSLLGPFPEHCPLDDRVIERVDCGSYFRDTVEYSVEANERIKSFLLIPKKLDTSSPAIFCHHQHNGEFDLGKSEVVGLKGSPDQAYASELAERGYVVIAPDAIAFEERNWTFPDGEAEYWELATRLVQGKTLIAKVLHDISVALNFVSTLPFVDTERFGFIGHSYGGRMAIWAAAFDERIKASVSHCGCVNYKNSISHEAGIQIEFCIPNIMNQGDIEDIVRLVAPRALRIQATDNDKWSRGAKEIFDYAKTAFSEGQLELQIWAGEHMFSPEMRAAGYSFLDKHLSV